MLILRTGLPGSGKTLNTIREIEQAYGPDPKKPNQPERTVYYYGIPDLDISKLKCNWVEFDTPDEWFNLPDGSVIVIDEAQRVFGAQDGRKARPEKVARFETHRHQGLDIYLITQHPSLIMAHVRKLVGKHVNMYRPYGGNRLIRHEYEFCIDAPEKRSNFKLAQESRIKLDPKYFGVYRSATVHTHKFKLPNYVWLIPPLVAMVLGCFYYLAETYLFTGDEVSPVAAAPKPSQMKEVPTELPRSEPRKSFAVGGFGGSEAPLTPEQYRQSLEPRVAGFPHTAPRYDRLTEPVSFPRPFCAASFDPNMIEKIRRKGGQAGRNSGRDFACHCLSQQGTKLDVPADVCLSIVQNGYFDDTRPDTRGQQLAGSMFDSAPGKPSSPEPAAATRRVPAAGQPQPAKASPPVLAPAPPADPVEPAEAVAEYVPAVWVGGIKADR